MLLSPVTFKLNSHNWTSRPGTIHSHLTTCGHSSLGVVVAAAAVQLCDRSERRVPSAKTKRHDKKVNWHGNFLNCGGVSPSKISPVARTIGDCRRIVTMWALGIVHMHLNFLIYICMCTCHFFLSFVVSFAYLARAWIMSRDDTVSDVRKLFWWHFSE